MFRKRKFRATEPVAELDFLFRFSFRKLPVMLNSLDLSSDYSMSYHADALKIHCNFVLLQPENNLYLMTKGSYPG